MSVDVSDDGKAWAPLVQTRPVRLQDTCLPTSDAEARYIRLNTTGTAGGPVGIREVHVEGPEFGSSPNNFFAAVAARSPRGMYPRAFLNEQSYWTVVGVDGDDAEALINEEGAVELSKRGPTLEPFLSATGKLLTWADGEHSQSLERGYLPIPTVVRRHEAEGLELAVTTFADGDPGASILWVTYMVKSIRNAAAASAKSRGTLHIALRPFQVNPPWQKLNNEGGAARVSSVEPSSVDGLVVLAFNSQAIHAVGDKGRAGAASFECGDIAEWLGDGRPLMQEKVAEADGRASGEIAFDFDLGPQEQQEFTVCYPMHDAAPDGALPVAARREQTAKSWEEKVSRSSITVPKADQWIANAFKSQLAYILINRDGPAIQPGSRSYERSWARDGSMTSAALLTCGHPEEVKAWINWFGQHQFENGKIPCVVDKRGPDPVPEYDSNGEYIWAVANYVRYTHDQEFLKTHWPRVQKAVAYIQSLRAQRMTSEYASGSKRAFYGLVPESISHEGYSAKPMHSYWDDFFVLLGLKEAAFLAKEVGDQSVATDYDALVADFRKCLYDSIRAAMAAKQIDYIPGCVEQGDFDSTSTTIALFPSDELGYAPEPALRNTFRRYWKSFEERRSPLASWDAYTPYEIRHVGAFVRLGEPRRAYEALNWFHQYQRPQGWNHWAEVVWHDPKTPKFIGDMPHTWVGSDFLNSVSSMFAYTHGESLIVFAGVPRQWIDAGEPVAFARLVTPFGRLSGSLQRVGREVRVDLEGDCRIPENGVIVKCPPGAAGGDKRVQSLPARVSFTLADEGAP
jgi:hypothetical protein